MRFTYGSVQSIAQIANELNDQSNILLESLSKFQLQEIKLQAEASNLPFDLPDGIEVADLVQALSSMQSKYKNI